MNRNPHLPVKMALKNNYPNPFNNSTKIIFDIPEISQIDLFAINLLGQRVATIQTGFREQGQHSIVWNTAQLSSGHYLIVLNAGNDIQTIPCILMK